MVPENAKQLNWWVGLALLALPLLVGCAHAPSADGNRRAGASLVVSTAHGARQGELFAADDQRIWLCDDGVAVEVPKAQLVTAIATYTAPLDVMHPELWAGMARHPEGLPPEGASCDAEHDDAPVAQVVATTWDGTVQGPLLDVSATTVVMEVEHVPMCLPVAELADLKIALTHYGPEREVKPAPPVVDESVDASAVARSAGRAAAVPVVLGAEVAAKLGFAAIVLPPLLLVAGVGALAAGVAHVARNDPGVFTYRTSLAQIDLRRVATLKPFARYPKSVPSWLRCPPPPVPDVTAPGSSL